jgi:N-hydroxyarylamine O-acetyltransferase
VTPELVAAYLRRLGLEPEPPSIDALRRLHRAQVERVPYETLWLHLGESLPAEEAAAVARVAGSTFGGYCFHLNGAFSALLRALGYSVTRHVGGVHHGPDPEAERMTNHLVLVVSDLPDDDAPEGRWFVDAGLGDALHEPLPLVEGTYRQGPFEFGLEPADGSICDWHFIHDPRGGFTGMGFRAEPDDLPAFAATHAFLSTSPESGFVKVVTVQRRHATGNDAIRGLVFARRDGDTQSETTLEERTIWQDALAEVFGIDLSGLGKPGIAKFHDRLLKAHESWLQEQAP